MSVAFSIICLPQLIRGMISTKNRSGSFMSTAGLGGAQRRAASVAA